VQQIKKSKIQILLLSIEKELLGPVTCSIASNDYTRAAGKWL